MRIQAEITVFEKSPEKLLKVFEPEVSKKDRSGFDVKAGQDKVSFVVDATDSVALRATLNSITKLLTVYEKVSGQV